MQFNPKKKKKELNPVGNLARKFWLWVAGSTRYQAELTRRDVVHRIPWGGHHLGWEWRCPPCSPEHLATLSVLSLACEQLLASALWGLVWELLEQTTMIPFWALAAWNGLLPGSCGRLCASRAKDFLEAWLWARRWSIHILEINELWVWLIFVVENILLLDQFLLKIYVLEVRFELIC